MLLLYKDYDLIFIIDFSYHLSIQLQYNTPYLLRLNRFHFLLLSTHFPPFFRSFSKLFLYSLLFHFLIFHYSLQILCSILSEGMNIKNFCKLQLPNSFIGPNRIYICYYANFRYPISGFWNDRIVEFWRTSAFSRTFFLYGVRRTYSINTFIGP